MELLVSSILPRLAILIFAVVRGLFEWADKALLAAAAVAIGAYLGARVALSHFDGAVRARSIPEH
ncbi:MAG: hypothetical protein LC792_01695 [Actinobacteria bacterium]|nr:hypothetical protein [Actinomycetota bacterium]